MKNTIAKVIQVVGGISIIGGILLGLMVANDESILLGVIILISGCLSGMMLLGFAEIISLLQENVEKQERILDKLSVGGNNENNASKSMIQDIEDSLPNI